MATFARELERAVFVAVSNKLRRIGVRIEVTADQRLFAVIAIKR